MISAISSFIAMHDGNILSADQYVSEASTARFFMRLEIEGMGFGLERDEFGPAFAPLARRHEMDWYVNYTDTPKKMAILVSAYDHCLIDLLWRWDAGELDTKIPLVVSNHPDLRPRVELYDIPFHYLPVTKETALEAVRYHFRNVALVFAIASLSGLGAYILAYFVTYLVETAGLDDTTAILSNFATACVVVRVLPLVRALGDRIGRKPVLFIGCAGLIVLSVPGFVIAGGGSLGAAILGQLLVALPWGFVFATLIVTHVEIFPTRVRYSGASIGYNFGYMIFGGTAPLVATALVAQKTGSNIAPGVPRCGGRDQTYRLPLLRESEGHPARIRRSRNGLLRAIFRRAQPS